MPLMLTLFIISQIKAKDEHYEAHSEINLGESPIFSELSDFKTLNGPDKFFLWTKIKSMAYFDSFDKNSIIYISKNDDSLGEKITGKFYVIEPNSLYIITIKLYNNSEPSVLKRYVQPIEITQKKIEGKINFLYLQKKNIVYNLELNDLSKKIVLKLSRGTINP